MLNELFVERWSLKFGTLEPRICRVLDEYYWFHERHKLVSLLHFMEGAFAGTPFKNIEWRLLGVRVGRLVFDASRPDGTSHGESAGDGIGACWQSCGTEKAVSVVAQPPSVIASTAAERMVLVGRMAHLHWGLRRIVPLRDGR